jgi:hypothetical protein
MREVGRSVERHFALCASYPTQVRSYLRSMQVNGPSYGKLGEQLTVAVAFATADTSSEPVRTMRCLGPLIRASSRASRRTGSRV